MNLFYPYVEREACERGHAAACAAAPPARMELLDSVGTIYLVAADIYTRGGAARPCPQRARAEARPRPSRAPRCPGAERTAPRAGAVYEDHVSFTEHYPICEHARRMGRHVAMLTTAVARHANLPLYGESFHDNEHLPTSSRLPPDVREGASPSQVEWWIRTVRSAYCDMLGRPPDASGLLEYVRLLKKGRTEGRASRRVDAAWVRQKLGESDEAHAKRGFGGASEWLAFTVSGESAQGGGGGAEGEAFEVGVVCTSPLCDLQTEISVLAEEWWKIPCKIRRGLCWPPGVWRASLEETTDCAVFGRERIAIRPSQLQLDLERASLNADGTIEQWAAVPEALSAEYTVAAIEGRHANFSVTVAGSSGTYRFSVRCVEDCHEKGLVAISPHFYIKDPQHRTEANAGQPAQLRPSGKMVVALAWCEGSHATQELVLLTVQQARASYGAGWEVWVYVDGSVGPDHRAAVTALGAHVIDADASLSVARYGRFAFAFWPLLAAADAAVSHVVVREPGFRIIAREVHAVEEWVASGKGMHMMRDSRGQVQPFLAQLWGCKAPCLLGGGAPLLDEIEHFLDRHGAHVRTDTFWGNNVVLPYFQASRDLVAHDSGTPRPRRQAHARWTPCHVTRRVAEERFGAVTCDQHVGASSFPTARNATDFVGEPLTSWGDQELPESLRPREWECALAPLRCRRKMEWVRG